MSSSEPTAEQAASSSDEQSQTSEPAKKPAPTKKPAAVKKPSPAKKPASAKKPAAGTAKKPGTSTAKKAPAKKPRVDPVPAEESAPTAPTRERVVIENLPEPPGSHTKPAEAPASGEKASEAKEPLAAESEPAEEPAPAEKEPAEVSARDEDQAAQAETELAEEPAPAEKEPFPLPTTPEEASAPVPSGPETAPVLRVRGLVKRFGDVTAVAGIDLTVPAGSFYGIVGPNGAGKTTTLSMISGFLRADAGSIEIAGIDQATDPRATKSLMGILPDRLRTFDRLTARQLLRYYGLLRGLKPKVIDQRTADLARAFDLTASLGRVVSDFSAGMTKKLMLAGALIHSPRLLVLDEPFESVDPVSSGVILDILRAYVDHGGTVILSSHGMDLVERVCSRIAVIVGGELLAEGTVEEISAGRSLEVRFRELAGSSAEIEGLEWLHTFSA